MKRLQASDDRVAAPATGPFQVGADLTDPATPDLWECMPGVGVDVDKPLIAVAGHCVGGASASSVCDIAVWPRRLETFYPEAQLGFCGGLVAAVAARLPHKIAMVV